MANTIDIVIPDLGDFDNVEVIEILVSVGATVEREDGLITLETHLQTCVTEGLRSDDVEERERVIGEIVEVFNATGKL